MTFLVAVQQDEDGAWIAECPALPGCVSQRATRADAMANVRDAIAERVVVRRARAMPCDLDVEQVEVAV
jgi:predicted RNase H-like HicB family nuclease